MRIAFDAATKCVTVAFRGRIVALPAAYDSECAAVSAGEDYCRARGWVERIVPTAGRSLLMPRVYRF
jgi:hypothetical protein